MNYKQMLDKLAEFEARIAQLERNQHTHPSPTWPVSTEKYWLNQPTCNPQDAFK